MNDLQKLAVDQAIHDVFARRGEWFDVPDLKRKENLFVAECVIAIDDALTLESRETK